MNIKKYELFLQKINQELESWNFNLEENENILSKIINIHSLLKEKKYEDINEIINSLSFVESGFLDQDFRDWNFKDNIKDDVEGYNSIEIMSSIFLYNLKKNIWNKKK